VGDPRQPRVPGDSRDADLQRAAPVDRSRKHVIAARLVDRQRLAGDRRLVDVAVPGGHDTVHGNLVARPDDDLIAGGDIGDRQDDLSAAALDESLTRGEIDQGADCLTRALERPHLEPLREREEEDDAGRLEEIAQRQGADDRHHHQHVDVDGAAPQRRDCAADGKDAATGRGRAIQRRRRHGPSDSRCAGTCRDERARQRHQPQPCAYAGIRGQRLVVLEPHPHAGLADGVDHLRCRQPRRVVLHVQALADDVRGDGFHARQWLQPALEDDHFLIAVHPLNTEDGFRV
jgi:hypothetical protein